ncbi:MAG: hypothetical protein PHR50_15005 [Lachnospiraceae bacterium]|nr:hypothetical protein [Lachnospiraceae bacterium]
MVRCGNEQQKIVRYGDMKTRTCKFLLFFCLFFIISGVKVDAASFYQKTSTQTKQRVVNQCKRANCKKASRTYTKIKKRTTTRTHKQLSEEKKVDQTIKTTTVDQYYYKKGQKKVTIKTKITTVTTTKTTSYVRKTAPTIDQLKGIVSAKVINAWKAKGFQVVVSPSALSSGTNGKFSASKKKIYLRKNIDRIFLHELGHFVSFINGDVAKTNDFYKIYQGEKNRFTFWNVSYARSDVSEYFAESFLAYHTNGATLKKQCPRTYHVIQREINQL